MKNPWMSMWLSAANKAAGAGRGLWMAEAQRQQQAFIKEITKAWTLGSTSGSKPSSAKKRRSR